MSALGLAPLTSARSQFAFRFIDRRGISRQLTLDAHDIREALDVLLEAVPAICDEIAAVPVNPAPRPSTAQQTAWPNGNGDNAADVASRYAPLPHQTNGRTY
jgi:hypothetical protein